MMNQLSLVLVLLSVIAGISAVKIGIVGGGVGGASAAYYLRQLFKDDADIQLYEMERIGGRLAVEDLGGYRFETGGSVIHTKNKYMMELIDKFGLQKKPEFSGTFGLFNGQQLVFVSSTWPGVTTIKLFWRYGYDVIRLQRLLSATLAKFGNIYDLLDSGAAYDTVDDFIMAMDPSLVKLTGLPLSQYLKLSGFQESFINELVTAVTLTNYGQRPEAMHALVGLVALTGTGDELTSVLGGNYQVAARALEESGATVHRERVQAVEFTGDAFLVSSSVGGSDSDSDSDSGSNSDSGLGSDSDSDASGQQTRPFDIVVVAAPQTEDQRDRLEWRGLPVPLRFPGVYHNLSVTLVDGQVRASAFSSSWLPDGILCTSGCSRDLNSLGSVTPVNETAQTPDSAVHKLFSDAAPDAGLLERLFTDSRRQRQLSWLAYPQYVGRQEPLGLGNFTLLNHLYYLSNVERAASAMEMSVLAARNVANMAYTRWYNRSPPDVRRVEHTEL